MSEPYEIRASARRTRTMTAFREDGRVVVVVPARMTQRQRDELLPGLVQRLLTSELRRRAPRHDVDLTRRAVEIFDAYVRPHAPAGVREPSVRWVDNMEKRWASCTSATGEIRVSDRLREMPDWVADYVLLHEVAHLVVHGHGADFWRLVDAHPESMRARGFLDGFTFARHHARG